MRAREETPQLEMIQRLVSWHIQHHEAGATLSHCLHHERQIWLLPLVAQHVVCHLNLHEDERGQRGVYSFTLSPPHPSSLDPRPRRAESCLSLSPISIAPLPHHQSRLTCSRSGTRHRQRPDKQRREGSRGGEAAMVGRRRSIRWRGS